MGKAWKTASIFGGLAVTAFVTYINLPDGSPYRIYLLLAVLITTTGFVVAGIVYLVLFAQKRLNPLNILDDIRCTYWTKEKQMKVTLWFCDYSNSHGKLSCLAQFGKQLIDVSDRVTLDGTYMDNTACEKGRKRMVEFFKNDIEIADMSKARISVSIKPSGLWVRKRKEKEVSVLVINH